MPLSIRVDGGEPSVRPGPIDAVCHSSPNSSSDEDSLVAQA
jgi:hypothetical protein